MKRMILLLLLLLCLLLSGCSSLLNGEYHKVTPHEAEGSQSDDQIAAVSNYTGLYQTMVDMVAEGRESGIISVSRYDQQKIDSDMDMAIAELIQTDPIGAYAVENITFELGTYSGQSAVALSITYLHNRTEILKIQHMQDMEGVKTALAQSLDSCDTGVVLYVTDFEEMDFAQWVSDYSDDNPDLVMEKPDVTANIYPEEGQSRVVELKLSYQNSRETLRAMQDKVNPLFSAAAIYAGEDGEEDERYFKLYSFLMGLFQSYQLETSITPSYSLLQHGVGDTKAFATVYAAMCEEAGLECITVTGTKSGEPWYWNIVCCQGVYYHVDLWEGYNLDELQFWTDVEMSGYVWDYSSYPACGMEIEPEEEN